MRDDMAKVVTERPRRGHGNKSKKTTGLPIRRYDPDADYDEPVRLPIARRRQYGWDAKEFSDLIKPLKRYLRSCIGRPWSKVHSELSQKLDRRSISGSHIWDHVMWEIETDCYIGPDTLAYSNNRKYGRGDWPIVGLYVHPRTGLIREQRVPRRSRSRVSRPLSISTAVSCVLRGSASKPAASAASSSSPFSSVAHCCSAAVRIVWP